MTDTPTTPTRRFSPLLMIPGPIEVSPAVQEAYAVAPPGHLAGHVIEAFGGSLEAMREVWCADRSSQPFIVAGSGTIAMDMAVYNLVDPGQRVLVVNTGYFSDRMAEMLARRGARVEQVRAARPGASVTAERVVEAFEQPGDPFVAVFATHVDTSTGVRVDAEGIARAARDRNVLSVFDGVCATAAERFEMRNWGADVYLTASQKAIGLPPGLALLVASARALAARESLRTPPPMSVDLLQWLPIMEAYEARRASYFSTPATNLVLALHASLREILDTRAGDLTGMAARFACHARAADAMRAVWQRLGLEPLPDAGVAANALSAVRYPKGVGSTLVGKIKDAGVIVAGGLYPGLQGEYFRVGHMGYSATQVDHLVRTVDAVELALSELGHAPVSRGTAADVVRTALAS